MKTLKLVVKRDPKIGDMNFTMYVHTDEDMDASMPIFKGARDGLRSAGFLANIYIETPSLQEV